MTEETEKENSLNPEEEETSEEEPQGSEQDTPKKPEETSSDLEEKNRRLYARMKKAEEEAKALRKEIEGLKKSSQNSQEGTNILNLARTISVLKEYNPEELGDIDLVAKAKNIPLEEAAKTEEAQALIAARRRKVEQEKQTPPPSTKQAPSEVNLEDISPQEVKNLPPDQQEKWVELRRMKAGKGRFPKKPQR